MTYGPPKRHLAVFFRPGSPTGGRQAWCVHDAMIRQRPAPSAVISQRSSLRVPISVAKPGLSPPPPPGPPFCLSDIAHPAAALRPCRCFLLPRCSPERLAHCLCGTSEAPPAATGSPGKPPVAAHSIHKGVPSYLRMVQPGNLPNCPHPKGCSVPACRFHAVARAALFCVHVSLSQSLARARGTCCQAGPVGRRALASAMHACIHTSPCSNTSKRIILHAAACFCAVCSCVRAAYAVRCSRGRLPHGDPVNNCGPTCSCAGHMRRPPPAFPKSRRLGWAGLGWAGSPGTGSPCQLTGPQPTEPGRGGRSDS